MKTLPLILFLLASAADGLIIDRCTLAEELKKGEIVGYKGYTVEDYICLALYSSDYDTSMNISPSEYGVFQINSYWWCNDGKTVGRKNICGMVCTEKGRTKTKLLPENLLDSNLTDDIKCLKRILKEPRGLNAWETWKMNCKGKKLTYLTEGC